MARVLNFFETAVSPAPGMPDLLAASDTGSSNTDNLTNLDNQPVGGASVLGRRHGRGATVAIYNGSTRSAPPSPPGRPPSSPPTARRRSPTARVSSPRSRPRRSSPSPLASDVLSVHFDALAPAKPGNGFFTIKYNSITYDWPDNTDADRHSYNFYRSTTGGGPYTKLNAAPLLTSTYKDTAVTQGVSYYYVVTCVDTAGNESIVSDEGAAIPTSVSLAPVDLGLLSDTGLDQADRRTKTNNSGGPFRQVHVIVGGTEEDAVVRVYANGQLLGSNVATGGSPSTIVVSTPGYVIPNGNATITATQQLPGTPESGPSSALTIFVDADAPTRRSEHRPRQRRSHVRIHRRLQRRAHRHRNVLDERQQPRRDRPERL